MVRINHIDVAEIRRSGFVSDVDGVPQGQVPDGESFELCIPRAHAALVFVVKLRKAGGELAAARPRRRYDDERLGGFDVRVGAVPLVGHDDVHFGGIPLRLVVYVRFQPVVVKFVDEFIGGGLAEVLGDDHAVHVQAEGTQLIDLAQNVGTVGNTEIGADFIAFQVRRADDEDNFRLLLERAQNFALRVADEPGEHAAGVHIVEQLSAEFEVQLIVELFDSLQNLFALQFYV